MNEAEFADRIRQMIQHETELVNHRMTWFITSQGIFLAALGLLWDNDLGLVLILSLIGFTTSLSTQVSIQAAIRAVQGLEQCWVEKAEELEIILTSIPPVNGLYRSEVRLHEKVLFPWRLLPWFFAAMWMIIGVLAFTR